MSRQYTSEVVWVDFYANVALLDVPDLEFWKGMEPVALARTVPQGGELEIYRWSAGRIEERAAEIIRLFIGTSKMSYVQHLLLAASSTISSAGWSEVVFQDDQFVGLTVSASKDTLTILPSKFMADVIERHRQPGQAEQAGLAYFDFETIPAKNPALPASRGFERHDVGVLVTEVGGKGLSDSGLQVGDLILEVDGFEIDSEGKYLDPDYGRLAMRGLATRGHAAGESIPIKVWREGRERMVDYMLPRADFAKGLIPDRRYDSPPQYLMVGGLVFQPVNGPLLDALGQNKPVLLEYYSEKKSVEGRTGLVVLSGVLPDDYNLGYESLKYLLVDEINGYTVNHLEDIASALAASEDGFHRIRFMPDERMIHMVLDSGEMEAATNRILRNYRIPSASQL